MADFSYDWEKWILPDGRYEYISPSCARITGYTSEEFIADPDLLLKITHPDDRQMMTVHQAQHLSPSLISQTDQDQRCISKSEQSAQTTMYGDPECQRKMDYANS